MKKIIIRTIEMGDRVVHIGENPEMALTTGMTALFTQAGTLTTTLKEWGNDQSGGRAVFRAGALECRRMAGELRAAMRDVNEIARVLKPTDAPGAKEVFRMPRNRSFQALAAAGRHFAEKAEPLAALFTARGLPETFVLDLQARIAAFETAVGMKADGRTEQLGGTAGMDLVARALLETVQELRAIMRVHLRAKPALLAGWKAAARVDRSRITPATTPPPAPEVPEGSGS